jgi:hypothetical protein
MKLAPTLLFAVSLSLAPAAFAQSSQTKPAPAAPAPAKPAATAPAPTKTVPRSSNPEDPHTATTGGADQQTFQAGKKADNSAGCSTPTDARSAGIDTSNDSAARKRSDGTRTVCTTSGAEGVGAVEKPKKDAQKPKSAAAPASSTSATPR